MGCGDGMGIPGEVEVKVLHGYYLGVTSSGSPTLYSKDRPQGGLADGYNGLLAQPAEAHPQAHCGSGLPFSEGGGGDGRHHYVFPVLDLLQPLQYVQGDLGLVFAVQLQFVFPYTQALCYLLDGFQLCRLCYLNVTRNFFCHDYLCHFLISVCLSGLYSNGYTLAYLNLPSESNSLLPEQVQDLPLR